MALITCPECQQQISDQAAACPKCGYPLQPVIPQDELANAPTVNTISPKKKKTILIAAISVICIVAIIVTAILVHKKSEERKAALAAEQARSEYIQNLNDFAHTSLTGASDAESICNLTYMVWYDTIYKKLRSETRVYTHNSLGDYNDDFNDSLSALYRSDKMISDIAALKTNMEEVDTLYKLLLNPDPEFEKCFEEVEALYSAYYNITDLAITPSGNITTYSSNFTEYDDDYLAHYNKLLLLIPEEDLPKE